MGDLYRTSGTENLRADASIKAAAPNASPTKSGKDAGGTENLKADHKVFDGEDKPLPVTYRHDVPPGIQSFDDNGQKDGGTKYLGR